MSRSDLQEPPSADGSCLDIVDDGLSWENAYSFGSIHTSVAGAVSSREWFRSRSQGHHSMIQPSTSVPNVDYKSG